MAQPKVFKGVGTVYAKRLGVTNAPMRELGDVEQLKLVQGRRHRLCQALGRYQCPYA